MSDEEIEQELQNALKPGHKRIPKLLISVVGIIGLLVGYFGVLQLNKLELTRFSGHLILREKGVHDAKTRSKVPT